MLATARRRVSAIQSGCRAFERGADMHVRSRSPLPFD